MTEVLLIAVVVLGLMVRNLLMRVRALETEVLDLRRDETAREPMVAPEHRAGRASARVRLPEGPIKVAPTETIAPPLPEAAVPPPESVPPPRRAPQPARISFESIVGGKLPIWIGGAALVLSAFFLVRYSIESGLLGPAARTSLAGLFGLLLIAGSEVARRLPATRDDPRVGQVLAGAGTASLYAALYVGAALYHLIGTAPAFALMAAVTLAALGLALRHGSPTAIMALIGGFVAPLLAGLGAGGVGPLLVYLALLIAALFGLAIRRGWAWLALAACGGGFAWANLLIAMMPGGALAGVGGFVLLLAVGATLALPGAGASSRRPWLRLVPLVAGLVQLLVLAPALDFSGLSWGLYLLLSAAALWLGWRDAKLAPGAGAALALVLMLLAAALLQPVHGAAAWAAVAITVLFAVSGHVLLRQSALWAMIAVGGAAGPALVSIAFAPSLLAPVVWGAVLFALALACAAISWRGRAAANPLLRVSPDLVGGAAAAALLAGVAAAEVLPDPWRWPAWLAIGVALAGWSRRAGDAALGRLAMAPALATAAAVVLTSGAARAYVASVLTAAPAPPLADLLALGLLPAGMIAATGWLLTDRIGRALLGWIGLAIGLSLLPAALPAPWHAAGLGLATALVIAARLPLPGASVAAGVATLAFAWHPLADLLRLVGWSILGDRLPFLLLPPIATILRELTLPAALIAGALTWRRPIAPAWRRRAILAVAAVGIVTLYALAKQPLAIGDAARFTALGMAERVAITQAFLAAAWAMRARQPALSRALLVVGLARFVWFDLLILDPAFVAQAVGAVPVFNLATLDAALIAAWLWPWRNDRRGLIALLAAVLVAVAATVRQAAHGTILTGAVDRTETWLYSAALLGLAIVWLGIGIRDRAADLRVAGLALLTAVTLKVFLIDAAALEGILRILSFMGLGFALIGIGWAYRRLVGSEPAQTSLTSSMTTAGSAPPAGPARG
ncbi:DUF2339 domain-containing protein [Sphingomonas sp. H39-1-10]|uniref:DUF2339 domain-containing protein n=1 Tax=Sphingomonas pollutisoli TaxID=3030829 RepID=UPI0023B8D37E|nr:DUF2339 domain-containing protein [Sphingomonas pollutisoli]MDF0487972.1 DUF2339 domain-containing protein [Sphingomonas pollutisoli]